MRIISFIFLSLSLISCKGQNRNEIIEVKKNKETKPSATNSTKINDFYEKNKGNDLPSKSTGSVSNGKLENGKLMSFYGTNFTYFDTLSYFKGRAYVNENVKTTVIKTYEELLIQCPKRHFYVMECSNKEGGKINPHHTHQNGLSVDFMMPLLKAGKDYYGLDTIGSHHYWLEFDNNGNYSKDNSISIDFDLIAKHILLLNEMAKKQGLKISKVIIKTELKDELFATENGKALVASKIYVVQKLTPLINSLHDEHYHIDFEEIK